MFPTAYMMMKKQNNRIMGCQYKYISLQNTLLTFNTMAYNLGPIHPVQQFKFTPEISELYIHI